MITKAKIIGDGIEYETYSRQEPGVGRGNQDFIMSRGELMNFASNPARWLAGYKEDQDETVSTKWGSMIDCLLTSPAKFESLFAVSPETYPDRKTGKQKPWTGAATLCKEWEAEQGDKTIIKSAVADDAALAVKMIRANEIVAELFAVSRKQVFAVAVWKDESGREIPLRVLIDLVPPKEHATFGKWLADFKTARNGNPALWPSVADKLGYDVQAALYRDVYCEATGEDRADFLNIVQENVFPFHVTSPPPALSSEFLSWGRSKYCSALKLYCSCLSTGIWPSFPQSGIAFGNTQIIGPDNLWSYRTMAGLPEIQVPPDPYEQPPKGTQESDYLAGS